jgi:murein DD-endopeptidase MepM/ murein hydrolase activator NlpD
MSNISLHASFVKFLRGSKHLVLVCGLVLLASCSSSTDGADTGLSKEQLAKLDAERVSLKITLAKIYPDGQMTQQQEIASKKLLQQNPAVLKMSGPEATRGVVPQVATAATFMPVYRIQNTTLSGSYFFSIWEAEKNAALAANPAWNYEGPAFYASQANATGLSPVWRFRNKINGSYLFTIYEGERASIASTYADTFEYEGIAWYASQTEAAGYQPLYRFRNLTNGTYLFSAYDSEKRDIIANYPSIFEYEGVSYYVRVSPPSLDNIISAVQSDGQLRSLEVKSDLSVLANCYIATTDFSPLAGQMTAANDSCGKFLGYTDASNNSYSIGRFEYAQDLSSNISIEVSQKKIFGNLSRPVEVYFLGGAFGWAFSGNQAYYYLYESETHWTGWIASTQFTPADFNKVSIHQAGRSIVVNVNGNELDRFELNTEVSAKRVSIFFKGDPGVKETMQFDEFLVIDRSINVENVSEMDGSSNDTLQVTSNTSAIVATNSISLGGLLDIGNPPVRKISITNNGSATLAVPQIVGLSGQGSSQIAFGGSNTCANSNVLLAGKTCSVFLRPISNLDAVALTTAPTTFKMGVVSGASIKPIAVTVKAVAKTPATIINDITPNIVTSGTRYLFTVLGTNLPATLALNISGSTCENTTKPAVNKIYCTISSGSNGRIYVMNSSASSATQIAARFITINLPSLYKKPLDNSYITSANVTLEFGDLNTDVGKYHTGVDIMTKDKNPTVYAIADGTVKYNSTASTNYDSKYSKYFNAFVIVDHGSFYAYYGHLSSSLKAGATIKAGDSIGIIRDGYRSDSTVKTSLNHLHLSISKGKAWETKGWGYQVTKELATSLYVNPMKYAGF